MSPVYFIIVLDALQMVKRDEREACERRTTPTTSEEERWPGALCVARAKPFSHAERSHQSCFDANMAISVPTAAMKASNVQPQMPFVNNSKQIDIMCIATAIIVKWKTYQLLRTRNASILICATGDLTEYGSVVTLINSSNWITYQFITTRLIFRNI